MTRPARLQASTGFSRASPTAAALPNRDRRRNAHRLLNRPELQFLSQQSIRTFRGVRKTEVVHHFANAVMRFVISEIAVPLTELMETEIIQQLIVSGGAALVLICQQVVDLVRSFTLRLWMTWTIRGHRSFSWATSSWWLICICQPPVHHL